MHTNSFPEGLRNITLRDVLAMNERTLPSNAWLNRACHGHPLGEFPSAKQAGLIADYRYFMADAMLKSRAKLLHKEQHEKATI